MNTTHELNKVAANFPTSQTRPAASSAKPPANTDMRAKVACSADDSRSQDH